ncbi:prepilin peptidase [Larsenimonas suaedae]|uniref:Prepilin leader peptidase/N-methyltransferase n=1 Tax=Larsenimonas suaedae TaxID=1851019 RepID=A0ABU1GW29_9GAMM|nr:A24 family peptidase [Larsenimonas suaedae]MCM2971052.1 A24 family peptidase [Larsenimonas suaedae]MDR5895761.1 A24 family peptidase [Larsenimonas suaedae]
MDTLSLMGWIFLTLAGLSFGSFLNVVIKRLPVMLDRYWRRDARATLNHLGTLQESPQEPPSRLSLLYPRSHCPMCKSPIRWHDNLPLIGWLKRRGRCRDCNGKISWRYPAIEFASALLVIATIELMGPTIGALFVIIALLILLALAVIDADTLLLPDVLTLPLLWLGLLYHVLIDPSRLQDAVLGAMIGYSLLWSFYWLFKIVTGKEGMGYGDFKLLAALGAWCGWIALPMILMIAAGSGAVISILILTLRGQSVSDRGVPFGPYLALAGMAMLLFGDTLTGLYSL